MLFRSLLSGWSAVRDRISHEDELMERTASYGFFAERYHWTPQQVEALPFWYASRLPAFAGIVDEVQAEKQKAASR